MKERILRLCKRLDKFSLEDIVVIADDIQEQVLELLLLTLVHEKRLIKKNGIYFYNRYKSATEQTPILKRFSKDTVDLTLRAFCSDITADKIPNLISISEDSTMKLYSYFRKCIYNNQYKQLCDYYNRSPQKYRTCTFFNSYTAYFYIYNNVVSITDNPFVSDSEKNFSKSEIKEFKKIYSYLSRIQSHNKNKINIHHKLAEALWRRNKSFKELYEHLKSII